MRYKKLDFLLHPWIFIFSVSDLKDFFRIFNFIKHLKKSLYIRSYFYYQYLQIFGNVYYQNCGLFNFLVLFIKGCILLSHPRDNI